MSQAIGSMPGFLEEKNRVLHWSSEVLVRVQDNVTNEDTFLMNYHDGKINAKIDNLIRINQTRVDETFNKFPNASNQLKDVVNVEIEKVMKEIKGKIKENYLSAYNDIKKFTKKVDYLGLNERKNHSKLQDLTEECAGDMSKFKKFKNKTFDNLRTTEKMLFEEKKLQGLFAKKVFEIDHKYSAKCAKRLNKLLENFAKNAAKESM